MIKSLDDLFEEMPGEGASEEEIEAFMTKVMAQPGGLEMIQDLAKKMTEGVALEEEEAPESLVLKSPARLIFRVELLGTKPLIWRRLSLPADCAFFHLHSAIQDAFGWENRHLHRFEVWEDGRCELKFGPGDDEGDEEYCEVENQVMNLFREQVGEFFYLYDYGDEWRHRVVIEDFIGSGMKGTSEELTPKLHDGAGHGPPEDCGGVIGFEEFLKGEHPFCEKYEEDVLEAFRKGEPDLSKVAFRDPVQVWRR